MIKTITKMPCKTILAAKKKVAAYARVSSGKDAMLHSLSAQVSSYSKLIQSHSDWQYVGVYADEAITGTKAERPNFQRMLDDCRNGLIDMVITKSISRFARNTVTLLDTVRELKSLNVDVYFEEQNIHTLSADGELMLTILASYAQEESRSVSENMKWRVKRNFENGLPWNCTIYGYRFDGEQFVVYPKEADIVKQIFNDYLSGMGTLKIAEKLNESGVPTRTNAKWSSSTILGMLKNRTYTGELILQKTFQNDYISKKKILNNGALPMYEVSDSHQAIIDDDTFTAVQAEIARRAKRYSVKYDKKKKYAFTGKLICSKCGKHYRRKTTKTRVVWICDTYNTYGKKACPSKAIPEETLEKICDGIDFENITVCDDNTLIIHLKDGSEKQVQWQDRSRRESWTDEMRNDARQKSLERIKQNGKIN